MTNTPQEIQEFVSYASTLKGDEKGEAQVFCDRLFRAFGHAGCNEAGATLEFRVKAKGKSTRFADLFWESRLLLEMKKRGEKLERHYQQVFEYWLELVPNRPKYVVLCNFDEFWIYDFDVQMREPIDRLKITDLPDRYTALNFLFPNNPEPTFNNNLVAVTRAAADKVAQVFNRLVERKESPEMAQRFILQCVVALFAEDIDLLPKDLFTGFLKDCKKQGGSSFDLIGGLFRQMGSDRAAPAGSRYHQVSYFNGGIFSIVEPIDLTHAEINLLLEASAENWSKVEPAIFGTLFESSMGKAERHALGAHYTSEVDIQKVILPTIIRPWRERIEAAKTLRDLLNLRQEMTEFKVLDPACGSGNFLYVAYREMKHLEAELLTKIHGNFTRGTAGIGTMSLVKTTQFHGIDIKPFAVELAKVTLMLAKKLALDEESQLMDAAQINIPLEIEQALPLDDLDHNIRCEDALFCEWEQVNAIIGNPPFLGSYRMRSILGDEYVDRLSAKFPEVKGKVDLCTYWFRLAHNHLKENCRAGLVGTNTISQGHSRKATLNYITDNNGYIYDVISTQPWSGEANVYISIVNWYKKPAHTELPNLVSKIDGQVVSHINSSLKAEANVSQAKRLQVNFNHCFMGIVPNGRKFLLTAKEAQNFIQNNPRNEDVIKLFSMGENLARNPHGKPIRWIIDFRDLGLEIAESYAMPFDHLRTYVKQERDQNRNLTLKEYWWRFHRTRQNLRQAIANLPYFFVVPEVSKWTIFLPSPPEWLPGNGTSVVASDDFYVLGILTSSLHRQWIKAQNATLEDRTRYTPANCFENFPFPQNCPAKTKIAIRAAMQELHDFRTEFMERKQCGITQIYNQFFGEPASQLAKLHTKLDQLVATAYSLKPSDDPLKFLLDLNTEVATRETQGLPVVGIN